MPLARLARPEDLSGILQIFEVSKVSRLVEPRSRAEAIWLATLERTGVSVFVSEAAQSVVATCMTDNERLADVGLLLLLITTGAFLIYQSHDNVFSATRMDEFETFMGQFGFAYPALLAPLSVYAQFTAGISFIVGLFTRWFGLITAFNFVVALWMVHWNDPVPQMWPAAVLIVLGLYFGLRGSGRFGVDAALEGSPKSRRR
jgi:putative oxidoreductase